MFEQQTQTQLPLIPSSLLSPPSVLHYIPAFFLRLHACVCVWSKAPLWASIRRRANWGHWWCTCWSRETAKRRKKRPTALNLLSLLSTLPKKISLSLAHHTLITHTNAQTQEAHTHAWFATKQRVLILGFRWGCAYVFTEHCVCVRVCVCVCVCMCVSVCVWLSL